MILENEQCQILRNLVKNELLSDCSISENYSGRGMYGRKCFGIVIDRYTSACAMAFQLAALLAKEGEEDLLGWLSGNVKEDSMGLGTIVYFPDIQWPENDGEEADEDTEEVEEEELDEDA